MGSLLLGHWSMILMNVFDEDRKATKVNESMILSAL